ncbi:MAG: hypothetical protein H0X41_12010 [Chitinophagaceae bacterium]|nr:hypothetical protein [Chitinophagaceae bacterium]
MELILVAPVFGNRYEVIHNWAALIAPGILYNAVMLLHPSRYADTLGILLYRGYWKGVAARKTFEIAYFTV